jgi:hypothetical protein
MRHARRFLVRLRWWAGALPLCAALGLGCQGQVGPVGGGGYSVDKTPLCAVSDPKQVVAPQRVALLTSTQLMNMVRLVDPAAATMVIDGGFFPVVSDTTVRFPPPRVEQYKSIIDVESLSPFNNTAQKVGDYVRTNFAAVTKCTAPATDSCATAYLNTLAKRAYRRELTAAEQERFTGLYSSLRSQIINNFQITATIEEATGDAVYALLMSPQLLWRWELGATASASPPGVALADTELASNLSFFLTDQPPDDMLIADAKAGTLRANLAAHTTRILGTQTARDWLTHVMEMYFFLNQLPGILIDSAKFPIVGGGAVYADLQVESRMFLSDVMWNGKVTDLLTSRKAFLNPNLATMVYNVPVPAGATPTTFVATMLPQTQRAGMLTNAGFITTRARTQGVGVIPRGLGVKALFLCLETPPPPESINMEGGPVKEQAAMLDMMTAQEQVASRATTQPCASCHPSFDPYGLVLDWYDVVGRFREVDDLNKPVDGTTTLPPIVGGQTVKSAVELANVLMQSDVFTNCMAKSVLQYALIDTAVEVPVTGQAGCAAAGVAHALRASAKQSFTDLAVAVATSSAFTVRQQTQ